MFSDLSLLRADAVRLTPNLVIIELSSYTMNSIQPANSVENMDNFTAFNQCLIESYLTFLN